MKIALYTLLFGVFITVILTAANVYLGLLVGMTVSASIPASVMAMALFRLLRKNDIHQSNAVQTMASAGESLAAGTLFTIPALVLVNAWQGFNYFQTTLIAIGGGLLGVLFMIPLRRALLAHPSLTYPEGVACSEVLRAGVATRSADVSSLIAGAAAGSIFKFLSQGLSLLKGTIERAVQTGGSIWYGGSEMAPALLGIGYIVNLNVASLVFIGGCIGWIGVLPLLAANPDMSPLDNAWALWSSQVRYAGVGAMVVGGIWSIIMVRRGLVEGMAGTFLSLKGKKDVDSEDLSGTSMRLMFLITGIVIVTVYGLILRNIPVAVVATLCMIVTSFLFSAVSSYITGLVGSSNNPVSGMTISALLLTAVTFLIVGIRGDSAILATLGVAAVVCCAACTAGDCSQDLKTGQIIGTPPRLQQIAQMIGIVAGSVVISPILTVLHQTEGIGEGLKAPQATLFASIVQGIFGSGELPYDFIFWGMAGGSVIIVVDQLLARAKTPFRLHVMPVAIGVYLPIGLAVPIFVGGLIRFFASRVAREERNQKGVLLASGLIAGEALMGVLIAVLKFSAIPIPAISVSGFIAEILTIAAFLAVILLLSMSRARGKSIDTGKKF